MLWSQRSTQCVPPEYRAVYMEHAAFRRGGTRVNRTPSVAVYRAGLGAPIYFSLLKYPAVYPSCVPRQFGRAFMYKFKRNR